MGHVVSIEGLDFNNFATSEIENYWGIKDHCVRNPNDCDYGKLQSVKANVTNMLQNTELNKYLAPLSANQRAVLLNNARAVANDNYVFGTVSEKPTMYGQRREKRSSPVRRSRSRSGSRSRSPTRKSSPAAGRARDSRGRFI
jgi:hypothetical protein